MMLSQLRLFFRRALGGKICSYENKVVLISGASSGIGEELAKAFFREGARLVLLARRLERLENLKHRLDPSGQKILVLKGDVTSDRDIENAIAQALDRFHVIDVVVANAGLSISGRVESLSLGDYQRQFETNVFGALRLIKASLPSILAQKGQIAIMGSVAGLISQPFVSPYAMSKFAITALAHSLFHEVRSRGVGVSLIAPGFVQSEIQQIDRNGQYNPNLKRWIPDWITVPVEKAVAEMMVGLKLRKKTMIITNHGRFLVFVNKFFPWLMDRIVGWSTKKRLESQKARTEGKRLNA
jgi:short-subunit dehydrogenase